MEPKISAADISEFSERLRAVNQIQLTPAMKIDFLLNYALQYLGLKCVTLYLIPPQLKDDAVLWRYPGVEYTAWMFGPLYPDSARKCILEGKSWRTARWPERDPPCSPYAVADIHAFSFTSREKTDFYLRYDSRNCPGVPRRDDGLIHVVMFLNFPAFLYEVRSMSLTATMAYLTGSAEHGERLLYALDSLFHSTVELVQTITVDEILISERPGGLREFDNSLLSLFTKSWSRITSLAWESMFDDIAGGIERLTGGSPGSCTIFAILKPPSSRDDVAEFQVLNQSNGYAKEEIVLRAPNEFAPALVALKHSPLVIDNFMPADGATDGRLITSDLAPGFRIEVPADIAAREMSGVRAQTVVPVITAESRAPVGIIDLRSPRGIGDFPLERIRMVYRLGYIAGIAINMRWLVEHLKFITSGFFHDLTEPMHRLRNTLPRPQGQPELEPFLDALHEHIEFMFQTVTAYQDLAHTIAQREDPRAVSEILAFAGGRDEPYVVDRQFFTFVDHLFAFRYTPGWQPVRDPQDVQISFDLEAEQMIDVSPAALRTIIYNLLKNALLHAFYPGWNREKRVLITTRDAGDNVLIQVQDSGAGMPEHLRSFVNSPRRDEMAIAHRGGLYTVRKLARLMGISLLCQPASSTDSGTTFTLTINRTKEV